MLLDLARDLLSRAEHDLAQPMPVVFNLASWTEARPSLAEWLVDELHTKYNIPRKVAQLWVEEEALVLLLDGLDEVSLSRREACLKAINTFHQSHGLTGLVAAECVGRGPAAAPDPTAGRSLFLKWRKPA
jgi:predicted NACHT family NTPase